MNAVVSRDQPLSHYLWGDQCDGWNLVDGTDLSVKMERMPPHAAEREHFHRHSRQFFFILEGAAVFYTQEGRVEVRAQQGFEIQPGVRHYITNESAEDVVFLLCSQPSTKNDRIES